MTLHHHGSALLQVEVTWSDTGTTLRPVGELDVATIAPLAEAILGAVETSQGELILDLAKLSFIDVTGVRAILDLARQVGSRLRVEPGPPQIQRVFELTGAEGELKFVAFDNVSPFPGVAERNLKYVRRIWKAFMELGVDGMLKLIPPDVEWLPWGGGGRVLRGSDELRTFYGDLGASGRGIPGEFSSVGDDVLVNTILPLADGNSKTLFSLYEFDRGTLKRATSYEREADARAAVS